RRRRRPGRGGGRERGRGRAWRLRQGDPPVMPQRGAAGKSRTSADRRAPDAGALGEIGRPGGGERLGEAVAEEEAHELDGLLGRGEAVVRADALVREPLAGEEVVEREEVWR